MSNYNFWEISGTYYEVCNCEAVCPCRRHGGNRGGRSTYGFCDFALSWHITKGQADNVNLSGLSAVLAGSYNDDEPRSPWRVIIYVDEKGDAQQRQALADIFLGRAGGGTLKNFAAAIGEVYAVRAAIIDLQHSPNQERMAVKGFISAATAQAKLTDQPVSCGIPGYDRPGQEIIADHFQVEDENLSWEVNGRCGFATSFAYRS
jgi:hypothetical protein